MRRTPLFALLAALALAGGASAASIFTATMEGAQTTPPNPSAATGAATLVLNDAETELSYQIDITGLDFGNLLTPADPTDEIAAMHIHVGAPGVAGGIVFGIKGPPNDLDDCVASCPSYPDGFVAGGRVRFEGIWDAADESTGAQPLSSHLSNLKNGQLYLNAHTPPFPNGEIRGQIVPEPATGALLTLGIIALSARRRRS